MAQILKRCEHTDKQWAKCEHSWTVRWWDTQAGKQRERSFKRNHAAAKAFSKTIEADKLSVHYGDPKPVLFKDYAETWLASFPGSVGTVRVYRGCLANHLLPAFGDRQLQAVADDRQGMTAFLKGLSNGTGPVVYTCLRAMLSEAQRGGRITGTRLSGIRLEASQQPAEFDFPDHARLTTLADAMPPELRPAIWLMRGCGLRPGEVLAVKREGFSNGRLRIDEQVQENPYRICPLKARKPGEYRDIPVPSYVKATIQAQPIQSGYLFPGTTLSAFGNAFRKAAEAAGLNGFTPHKLRHVFASVALQAGLPITDVSRWLGHRSIEVTYRIYSHFVPSAWDDARAALDAEYESWVAA
jgi:integrase